MPHTARLSAMTALCAAVLYAAIVPPLDDSTVQRQLQAAYDARQLTFFSVLAPRLTDSGRAARTARCTQDSQTAYRAVLSAR